jgi:serine protease Do
MLRARSLLLALGLLTCASPRTWGQSGLSATIGDLPLASFWIYDDLDRGLSLARATVDLQRFQFDYDVSLVAILMHADGTIYGRYGTRASRVRTDDTHISPASFERALERGLKIHSQYPANRAALAGKQPRKVSLDKPEDAPELVAVAARPITRSNCIHCHMAGEALLRDKAAKGELTASDIWLFPLPDNLGAAIDKEHGLKVKSVRSDSPAQRAGLRPGDEMVSLNGQPLVSQADVQWVLHHVPIETQLALVVEHGGQQQELTLQMAGDWKRTDLSWRPSLAPIRNGLHVGPMTGDRAAYGISATTPALMVRYAFRAANKAGLRAGDVLVGMDGLPMPKYEGDFLEHCRLRQPAPKEVKLTVRNKRGEERIVTLPLGLELVPE